MGEEPKSSRSNAHSPNVSCKPRPANLSFAIFCTPPTNDSKRTGGSQNSDLVSSLQMFWKDCLHKNVRTLFTGSWAHLSFSGIGLPCEYRAAHHQPAVFHYFELCALRDSNSRPFACKAIALPTELSAQAHIIYGGEDLSTHAVRTSVILFSHK